jgi:Lrp/AsnC family leucine-responsive transcriptional regulator
MYKLDDTDRQIIGLLGTDARLSLSDIGKELNLSHVTIRNRLINLFENNLVKTSVLVNILKLHIEIVHLLVQTEGVNSTRELINRFKDCPRIIQMSTVLGQFRTARGVRNSSILSVGGLVSPPFFPIKFRISCKKETPCGLNCEDCEEYKLENCLGCPATSIYKGLDVFLE